MTPPSASPLATRDRVQVLGWPDIGLLAVSVGADLALFELETFTLAEAAVHNPVHALLLCIRPESA